MENIVQNIKDFVWGKPMLIFLLGAHIYLTLRTRFVQRKIFKGIALSFKKDDGKGDVSVFGALTTALASTVGTGNIIGMAGAVIAGGPGAVFWTWIGGFFGVATKYAETFIAVKHREKNEDGSYIGGAMTALKSINLPVLAIFFCIAAIVGAFGIGCLTQANAIASLAKDNYNISPVITGIVLAVLTAIIVFGGIKSIANVCEKLVPLMSAVYIVGCIIILLINWKYLGQTVSLIISSAFSPKAVAGGFVGSSIILAIRNGLSKGLFSNEAGMGSAPQASAAGAAKNAVMPSLVGMTGVFWDTLIICAMTGLVLISSVLANPDIDATVLNDASKLCSAVFATIPYIGTPLLIFGVLTFSYSTILGWNYYATQSVGYLFNEKAKKLYLAVWVALIYVGSISANQLVWNIADIMNALMVIPNMIAVLLLTKEIVKDTDYYLYENHLDEKDPDMK